MGGAAQRRLGVELTKRGAFSREVMRKRHISEVFSEARDQIQRTEDRHHMGPSSDHFGCRLSISLDYVFGMHINQAFHFF